MSYGEEFFDKGGVSYLEKLDLIQNEALRLQTKIKTVPLQASMEALTEIIPLKIRRKDTILNLYGRFKYINNPPNEIYNIELREIKARKKPFKMLGK